MKLQDLKKIVINIYANLRENFVVFQWISI